MKLWVVGAKGLLGSALCRISPEVCIPSDKTQADISYLDSLRKFAGAHRDITHIVNCSAFSLVDLAETERKQSHLVNALGPENLGKVAKEINARLVHISTDYVFPGNIHRPLHEEDEVRPLNYYGETKLEGERRVFSLLPSACVIRTSALFGSGGKNFGANLFRMLQERLELLLADDQWNSPTFADDLAFAILQMLETSGLYHFANQGAATKFSLGTSIRNFMQQRSVPFAAKTLTAVPSNAFPSVCKRPVYSVFDTSKIAKRLSAPIRSWEEALHAFLERLLT